MSVRRILFALSLGSVPVASPAQSEADSSTVSARIVRRNDTPVEGAMVRSGRTGVLTDSRGLAALRLAAGVRSLVVSRLGFAPETLVVAVSRRDTTLTVVLDEVTTELAGVVVMSTRSERRVEDEPLRVEALSLEEVDEKLLMTPGDITMMLNETSGLRVQVTSPSLGGANVRVQGLRGRYTQVLSDGLPLFGGQTGGLGLLQIPPMDLGGVEVIKGVASALYGGSALGGVINLTSRRPGAEAVREVMLNRTTLGGTDVVAFIASRAPVAGEARARPFSYTLLGGGHWQRQVDRDSDGWSDLPGYERVVVRPRAFWSDGAGRSAMVTAGFTGEGRNGGGLPGTVAPDGSTFPERLSTRRFDMGGLARFLVGPNAIVSARGSTSVQRHRHTFGTVLERDGHRTLFGEFAYTRTRGAQTWVIGAAFQQERYTARDVAAFDYAHTTPGIFAQLTTDFGSRVALSGSARVDAHSEYGTFASPRVSLLLRPAPGWNVRASVGRGYFAPTPFTEETEVVGLTPLVPLRGLQAEEAVSGSFDIGGSLGPLELNGTLFGSMIERPVALRAVRGGAAMVELVNQTGATRTSGVELLGRLQLEPLRVTASYTVVRSREDNPATGLRVDMPLTPRHQAGLVTAWEAEGRGRVGVEVYYTGRQQLADDSYRTVSPAYVHVGVLVEHRVGNARLFINGENLLNVRQTTYGRLVRPTRGLGGRWTNDVWGPLEGRVANVGVRYALRQQNW